MIVTQETLSDATGYRDAARIRKCLTNQGIKVFTGKNGRIWTTTDLISKAGIELSSAIEFIEEDQ